MIPLLAVLAALQASQPTWEKGGESVNGTEVYFRPGPNARMVWMRMEMPDGRARSFRSLMEADCSMGRIRVVQGRAFDGPNFTGDSSELDPQPWEYPDPDTITEMAYEAVCGG